MPRALIEIDELHDLPLPIDKQVSRDSELCDRRKISMLGRIKRITEETLNLASSIFTGGQTNTVQD